MATAPSIKVRHPDLLKALYSEVLRREKTNGPIVRSAPTTIVGPQTSVFRAFDQQYFTVDTHRQILRRDQADNALIVRDQDSDQNRFTGKSHDASTPSWGGLYCALQQQAIVNEVAYYVEKERAKQAAEGGKSAPNPLPRSAAMHSKCVVKINLLGPFLAADLSAHNPHARSFVESLGHAPMVKSLLSRKGIRSVWDAMSSPDDYSVARGIGLAFAAIGFRCLIVQTARQSERSPLERGDNIIFFGHQRQRVSNLSVAEAYLFPITGGGLSDPNFIPGKSYPSQIRTYPVGF